MKEYDAIVKKLLKHATKDGLVGISIEQGWRQLIAQLNADLEKVDKGYVLYQVKEKFGGLRFYAACGAKADQVKFNKLINDAENKSLSMCQECGQLARQVETGGWIRTICSNHANR